jgi:hypothetical protein
MPGSIDLHCGHLDPAWAVPELTALAAEYADRERAALRQAADEYAAAPSLATASRWMAVAEQAACTREGLESAVAAVVSEAATGDPVEGARALIRAGRIARLSLDDEPHSVALFRASLDRAPLPEVLPWLVRGAHRLGDDVLAQTACQTVWSAMPDADARYEALDACARPYDGYLDEAFAWAPRSVRWAFVRQRIRTLSGDQPRLKEKGPPRTVRVVGICSNPRHLGVGESPGRRTVVLDRGEVITTRIRTGERIWLLTPSGYAEAIARISEDATGIGLSCGTLVTNPPDAPPARDAPRPPRGPRPS